jgi:hypothetical protein
MNAQELTRMRQKQANVYIGRQRGVDSSLQTWKVQARASSVEIPSVVASRGPNQGTGVMAFVNTKDTIGCEQVGVLTSATGFGTQGTYTNVLMKAASCAVCSDNNYAVYPWGVTLPCCPIETRQRYPIVNSNGVVVDMNTFITTLDAGPQCVGCQGQQYNDRGVPINCSCGTRAVYGGGIVAATTSNTTGMRLKFPS